MSVSAELLVVHHDPGALARLASVLTSGGYQVSIASSFAEASDILTTRSPALLITAIRLGPFNGLHLVIRGQARRPEMGAIIIDTSWDSGLETEARNCGAFYLVEPLDTASLLERVAQALMAGERRTRAVRRWPRKRLAQGLTATVGALQALVTDVSYGGLRLEVKAPPQRELPTVFEVQVLGPGVAVTAKVVWVDRSQPDRGVYGAAISDPDWDRARAWRGFVEAVA